MFYAFEITVPADTPSTEPLEEILTVTKGIITSIAIKFPAGCCGYVNVKIFDREHQIEPLNRDGWITGDDEPITISEYYELTRAKSTLKVLAHAEGSAYPHTITVRVTILPKSIVSFIPVVELLTRMMQKLGIL